MREGPTPHFRPQPTSNFEVATLADILVSTWCQNTAIFAVSAGSADFFGLYRQQFSYFCIPWHGRGRRFDPDQVHHLNLSAINHFQSISDLLNQAPKLRQAKSKAAFQPFARKLIHTLPA
jgi:hypothetical protein